MTAGAALVMWMGELVTERGIGNGMSLLIFAGIAARIPAEGKNILDSRGGLVFTAVCVAALVIIIGVVFVEQGQRRIPVQYAKRMVGRRMYGGTSTYLPLKVNQAGVIPVIFASSLIYIPHLITQLIQSGKREAGNGWWDRFVANYLTNPADPVYIAHLLRADHLLHLLLRLDHVQPRRARRRDEEVRWLHPRHPARQAHRRLSALRAEPDHPSRARSTWVSSPCCRTCSCRSATAAASRTCPFGGTAVLIMIGVGLDTVKQIESQLMQRNYEGFLK